MTTTVYAQQNDNLDAIAYRYFGQTLGVVEQLLELNPKLATQPLLALGTAVVLPDQTQVNKNTITTNIIQLWD